MRNTEDSGLAARATGVLLGRRLANREAESRRIGAFEGVPAMGLDAFGSVAYGPEAALTMLMPLGAAGLAYMGWITAPIIALLAILFLSYWQTIRAYPNNGGAYFVAKQNLGTSMSLFAASALMIDYVLNVAVGISAGVGALVSAVPALQPHALALCLGILALITLINLRGTLDSGRLFALPVYLFVLSFAAIFVIGIVKALSSGGHPAPVVAPPPIDVGAHAAGAWLLLRAVAAGCTAMTGVEAVSNGVGAFREPQVKYGHRTLAIIVTVLGVMLACVAYLVPAYRVGAMDETQPGYQSVLAQIAAAAVGQGALYYVALITLLCVLALSANTSFVGFPRLCRIIACDGFLPKPFAQAGRRLVFSAGIVWLALCAALLLIVFDGITNRLIPLFAIGAFSSFTVSQIAMVWHWRSQRDGNAAQRRIALSINAVGACATATALIVIIVAKFTEGAWITLIVVPLVIALLRSIRRYYARVEQQAARAQPLALYNVQPPVVVVMVEDLSRLALKAVSLGMSLSPDVIAVHLTHVEGPDTEVEALRDEWEAQVADPARRANRTAPRLVTMTSQRRTLHEPLLKIVGKIEAEFPRRTIAVLIPELVKRRWYQRALHTYRGRRLRRRLLAVADPRMTIVSVPWKVDDGS